MRRDKVSERIVGELQDQIHRGELKPGDRLPSERHLAASLKASRPSVREALRALELSGLVASRHGEGTFVQAAPGSSAKLPLSQFLKRERGRLLDLSQARQMLEPRLALLAAERATADDLARLQQALAAEGQHVRGGDVDAGFNADRAFHVTIAEATHSPTFIMLHNYLSDLVAHLRREAIYNESRRTPGRHFDHQRIYAAIARHDGPRARAAMLRHLKNVETVLIDALLAYERTVARLTAGSARRRPPPPRLRPASAKASARPRRSSKSVGGRDLAEARAKAGRALA
jgi:GntR family transcriptional repressor for pyruvate dehydrogenase complex